MARLMFILLFTHPVHGSDIEKENHVLGEFTSHAIPKGI